ncbi:hypothetical protein EDD17DRAFT_1505109 [Pisolithus thermaeus]|nr:hypothetical protein EDD17DRAFT_1505109 [Pisolithus thermaeus]
MPTTLELFSSGHHVSTLLADEALSPVASLDAGTLVKLHSHHSTPALDFQLAVQSLKPVSKSVPKLACQKSPSPHQKKVGFHCTSSTPKCEATTSPESSEDGAEDSSESVASEDKIPKPPGEPGHPGHGSYTLETALDWNAGVYAKFRVICEKAMDAFPNLETYSNCWPVMDMIMMCLKKRHGERQDMIFDAWPDPTLASKDALRDSNAHNDDITQKSECGNLPFLESYLAVMNVWLKCSILKHALCNQIADCIQRETGAEVDWRCPRLATFVKTKRTIKCQKPCDIHFALLTWYTTHPISLSGHSLSSHSHIPLQNMMTEHELPMPGTLADKLASLQTPMSSFHSAMDMECSMTSMTMPKWQHGDIQEDVQTVHEDKGLFGDNDYNNMSLDKYGDVPTSVLENIPTKKLITHSLCDKLKSQLCQLKLEHKSRVTTLEKIMNEHETMYQQECKRLHEEIHINCEMAASLERTMNECETVEMNNWVEKLSASSPLNLTHLMEQHDQELDEKVCKIEESMQAMKESEMANLEQRYVCLSPSCPNNDSNEPPACATPQMQSKAVQRYMHYEHQEDELEILCTSTTEWETPMSPSHNNDQYQASTMIDAVTKGIEATLRSILANGQALPKLKLFKEKFNFMHDTEFIGYESADPQDVHAYEYEDGPSPDVNSPIFNPMCSPLSAWNGAIIDNLLWALQTQCKDKNWPIHWSDAYLRSLIVDHYRQLRTVWRNAQPKLMGKGVLETPAETESQLVAAWEALLKRYCQQMAVVENLAKLKVEENEDDANAWKWLKDLTTTIGKYGMSSEESGIKNEVEVALHVKTLPWHCSVE